MFKRLTLLIALAIGLCWSGTSAVQAQTPDEYIYFDLAAGNVVFSGGNYTGYVYVAGESKKVTATHNAANKYYIYQSSTNTGNNDKSNTGYATTADFDARQNCRVPDYPAVSFGGQLWSDYITNNSDVDAVQTNWGNAILGTDRTFTTKRICFRNNSTYNVILDNIYTTFETNERERNNGGITIGHTEKDPNTLLTNCKVTLKLKGDNRVSNIFYYSGAETDKSELHLTSYDGDGSNSGSITVVSYVENFSLNNCCCIGCASESMRKSYRTYFDGGTVFAGMPKYKGTGVWAGASHVTHVIGSRRETGVIVNGGRLTSVSNSTAAAIGGGGYVNAGGSASVDIKGGYVYAYNHSIYADEYNLFVPCVAIGGSSSVEEPATLTTVNITGGHVYAQSKGGCAIGGGGSAQMAGGPAKINISGEAYVEAMSLAGSIGGHSFPAGTSIGGGTGGTNSRTNGGYAIFHIDGGTLRAGSIGGGSTLSSSGKVGYVKAYITDGDVQAQFMMAEGSTEHCIFEMSGGTLHGSDYTSTDYPLVKSDGGAVWMDDANGEVTISGGEIYENKASKGGAIYMTGGQLEVTGGKIYGNTATTNGGSAYMGGGNFEMLDGEVSGNTATTNGGGFYVSGGSVTITGGDIKNNIATVGNGGGFYSAGGTVNISNATISGNHADNGFGGGLYSAAGVIIGTEAMGTGATVSGNYAKDGAGFYVAGASGSVTTIQGGSTISGNEATHDGAGAYIASGNLKVNSSDIMGNHADNGNGGGFFVNGGALTLSGGNIGEDGAPNHAINGGGVYANGGEINISNGYIQYNTADGNGGGFYVQGGTATIEGGTVQYNTATNGGGLYMKGTDDTHKAIANFSNGSFSGNSANTAAGGIYVAEYAYLEMSGASIINGNNVPSGKKGGGVLIDKGTMKVMGGTGSSINVYGNYAGEIANRNNVYLNGHDDYITIDETNDIAEAVLIGISVDGVLPKPVLYSTDPDKLNVIYNKMQAYYNDPGAAPSGIFDDAHKYSPLYANLPPTFTTNYIYFVSTWFSEIFSDTPPIGFAFDDIDSPEDLAWFMFLANCQGGKKNEGKITADIDMSKTLWVPIGEFHDPDPSLTFPDAEPFEGTLEGNGHVISGLKTEGLTNYKYYGLFGRTKGATISNIVLTDCNFVSGEAKRMGCLIGEMDGGTVENCVVGGTVNVSGSESQPGDVPSSGDAVCSDAHYCVVGGLIGEVKNTEDNTAAIRNCISTAQVIAEPKNEAIYVLSQKFTAGGLVGLTSSNTVIENSFANPLIKHGGIKLNGHEMKPGVHYLDETDDPRYVGGLIGENNGTVNNCYVRLERGVTVSSTMSKFGMFAGYNGGSIDYCYAPDADLFTDRTYVHTPTTSTLTNYGYYDAVVRPYTYTSYLRDNSVTVENGTAKGDYLIDALNAWVEDANDARTADAGYSRWMRTKASDVNDDYPVLSFDNLIGTLDYTTVGSKDGIQLEYSNRFNEVYGRIEKSGEGCLFIYRTPWTGTIASPSSEIIKADNMKETEKDIKVFVENGIPLLQDADSTLRNVYTCKEFDGIRTWNLISSALKDDSPIGFNYGNNADYNEDANPCGASIATGNYASFFLQDTPMADLDLYCFYEPEYHWINFKRNSSSHWYMNATTVNLEYENEENLVRGKGYLTSLANHTLLQAGGELNNGDFAIDVTTSAGDNNEGLGIPAEHGIELKGYNLLGNPYQSYLDLGTFLTVNSGLFSGSSKSGALIPTYAVYDPEKGAYVQGMASAPSRGSYAPAGILAPHEGFFIVAESETEKGLSATFTNDMRLDKATSSAKRAEQPAYPLINLMVADASGESDIAVAEFGRPHAEAAAKMMNIGANGKVYFHYNGDDCALLFLNEDTDQLPVRFDAIEDGTYTMTWSTANAAFSYLHLVDNMTGMDVDMLSSDAYTFTASSSDYKSRFKLMFAYTGVEENEAAETETFAFMHEGALTVNGEGLLEVIDMSGRTIVSSRLIDAQNTVSLPQAAQGVYVLRLTDDNQSRVQKIVVR